MGRQTDDKTDELQDRRPVHNAMETGALEPLLSLARYKSLCSATGL